MIALSAGMVFRLALRQTEGLIGSILSSAWPRPSSAGGVAGIEPLTARGQSHQADLSLNQLRFDGQQFHQFQNADCLKLSKDVDAQGEGHSLRTNGVSRYERLLSSR
jgi:hypothetical protein